MKIKNILVAIALVFIGQNASAAQLTVYNESGRDLSITVKYGARNLQETKYLSAKVAQPESGSIVKKVKSAPKYIFKSGVHDFKSITWTDHFGNCYIAQIPSSRTMLMGTLVIRDNEYFDLNFTQKGVSSDDVRREKASRCVW